MATINPTRLDMRHMSFLSHEVWKFGLHELTSIFCIL